MRSQLAGGHFLVAFDYSYSGKGLRLRSRLLGDGRIGRDFAEPRRVETRLQMIAAAAFLSATSEAFRDSDWESQRDFRHEGEDASME